MQNRVLTPPQFVLPEEFDEEEARLVQHIHIVRVRRIIPAHKHLIQMTAATFIERYGPMKK